MINLKTQIVLLHINTTVYHNTTTSLVQNLSKKKKLNKWDKNKQAKKKNKERKNVKKHTHTPVNYVKKKKQNMYKCLRSFWFSVAKFFYFLSF